MPQFKANARKFKASLPNLKVIFASSQLLASDTQPNRHITPSPCSSVNADYSPESQTEFPMINKKFKISRASFLVVKEGEQRYTWILVLFQLIFTCHLIFFIGLKI